MKGTLALWYEPKEGAGPERVRVELHVNLWRDLPSKTNFLDLGLMFDNVAEMLRFYLYVPAGITSPDLEDLSGVLQSGVTANAVFNDVVRFGAEADGRYELKRDTRVDTVFKIAPDDTELDVISDPLLGPGTRITFTEALCRRLRNGSGGRYLRFRIRLNGEASSTFSSEVIARDRAFASSAGRLELTEFRLNERRSYPASFAERADAGRFEITTIHYFLIRDLEHQLAVQHAPFEKVRRLEAALWADYVASGYGGRHQDLTARLAERLVIYHWKVDGKSKGIKDFVAFASFRTTSTSLLFYAFVIVLLGATGSVIATFLVELVGGRLAAVDAGAISRWRSSSTTLRATAILIGPLLVALSVSAYLSTVRAGIASATSRVRRIGAGAGDLIRRIGKRK